MVREMYRLYRFLFARRAFYKMNWLIYRLALRGLGVLNYENEKISGEQRFLQSYFANRKSSTVLDVGGNTGEYARSIMEIEPSTELYSFEPHPVTFEKLKEIAETWGFRPFNFGCGSENTKRKLFDYADADGSKHASIYLDVIKDIHNAAVVEHFVNIIKLDDFVKEHDLEQVDLLKIDTEGSELDVLRGFSEFIREGRVKAIQFEFNEMNIASRVFFKDFWGFLSQYKFFRMMPDGLVPIRAYSPLLCEIFAYQNIVALLKH